MHRRPAGPLGRVRDQGCCGCLVRRQCPLQPRTPTGGTGERGLGTNEPLLGRLTRLPRELKGGFCWSSATTSCSAVESSEWASPHTTTTIVLTPIRQLGRSAQPSTGWREHDRLRRVVSPNVLSALETSNIVLEPEELALRATCPLESCSKARPFMYSRWKEHFRQSLSLGEALVVNPCKTHDPSDFAAFSPPPSQPWLASQQW
jgi:hypothetical protein